MGVLPLHHRAPARLLLLVAAAVACTDAATPSTAPRPALAQPEAMADLGITVAYRGYALNPLPDSLGWYTRGVAGGPSSEAWDINTSNTPTVVGFSERSYYDQQMNQECIASSAYVLLNSVPVDLFHRPGEERSCFGYSIATSVNRSNEVVGMVSLTGSKQAFYWRPSLTSPMLLPSGPWGGIDDVAFAINDSREIVGFISSIVAVHATVWRSFTPVDIHPASFHDSKALVINNTGLIAGIADGIVGYWKSDTRFISSGRRIGRSGSRWFGEDRHPIAINDSGVIAFSSPRAGGGPDDVYLWDVRRGRAPVRQTLAPTGIGDINRWGRLVGWDGGAPLGLQRPMTRLGLVAEYLPVYGASPPDAWANAVNDCGAAVGAVRKRVGVRTTFTAVWLPAGCVR